ncbi:NAD(P)-dependent dehydrogenase (short-subunit alcohol dehydrogenase family) [Cryobacterium sp. MP_M3]|nr:NAD(P)-dependent dehydrogenase (short-subunit alcohol dehydrogenase family) [Cryobacterium sp. MP_M3]
MTFTYLRDTDAAQLLTRRADRALAIRSDVADPELVDEVFATAEARLGPVTQLVNNAGVTGRLGPFSASTDAEMRAVFDVNVFGLAAYSRAATSRWVPSDTPGVIVNVGSTAAATGAPGE